MGDFYYQDGFSTTISLAQGAVKMKVISLTPPGIESGDRIPQTTMDNTAWRTFAPPSLKEMTEGSMTVAYDIEAYNDAVSQVGVNQAITITFPDGSTLVFWGYLRTFQPSELSENERPTATVTLTPTNLNDSYAETAPGVTTTT